MESNKTGRDALDNEPIRAVIARNVRKYRLAKGLSQEKLSVNCGFHHSYIGFIERMGYNPSAETLERIAQTLGIEEVHLLDRNEK